MTQKKILVPIDFSGCSIKALDVAIRLAKKMNARLIIMNAYQKPVAYTDAGTETKNLIKEAKSNAKKAFDRVAESIDDLQEVEHTFVVKHAFPQDVIISLSRMENIDLVVMGTEGASGFKGSLLGSNTYTAIKNVACPILAIPEAAETNTLFRNIVLASDYQNTTSKSTYNLLIEIAKATHAEFHVLHVSEAPIIKSEETAEAQKLDRYFKNFKHSFHFKLDKHIAEGIYEYIDENSANLLTIVAKKHGLLDRIFKSSTTRKMTYHSKVPLLILQQD
ncbi:MAG: nucleotide-binding universal stress UspA family protein [Nonlabens sp.]